MCGLCVTRDEVMSGYEIVECKTKLNENEIVDRMVEIERQRQYENFSLIYYNKIKLNSEINEL